MWAADNRKHTFGQHKKICIILKNKNIIKEMDVSNGVSRMSTKLLRILDQCLSKWWSAVWHRSVGHLPPVRRSYQKDHKILFLIPQNREYIAPVPEAMDKILPVWQTTKFEKHCSKCWEVASNMDKREAITRRRY